MNFTILHELPGPELEAAWRDCLTRVEFPSHYNTPEFFAEPYWTGKRPFAILALAGNKVAGVLTGIHKGDHVMSGLPSRPQICVDPAQNTGAVLEALTQGLMAEATSAELVSIFTWSSLPLPALAGRGFRRRTLEGSVVLDLTQGSTALFKQFTKDKRRNVRFAEKHGVEVREAATAEDMREAYEVYRAWRRTQRKNVGGEERTFEVFERAARLTGNRRLFLARWSGRVIAINIFRFCPGGLFESAANSSLDEFLHLKPNELLQWKGIEWACQAGLRRHSLGGSHHFLRGFGGSVVPILHYRLDCTRLRKHDFGDAVRNAGRQALDKMPALVEKNVRRLLGKE